MNKEIEIQLGKKLHLYKVVSRKLNDSEINSLLKTISIFGEHIKSFGLQTKGPLIIKTKSIMEDGIAKNEITLMSQLLNPSHNKLSEPYKYVEEVIVGKSLYAKFIGDKNKAAIANFKIQVVAYENNINLKGEIYSVFVSTDDDTNEARIDYFAPVYEN